MASKIDYARKRILAVREEINRLEQSEFPYPHPLSALTHLGQMFDAQQSVLSKVSPEAPAALVEEVCSTSLYQLHVYLPILGFILRSTNVRNAFEAYYPLLRLARKILQPDTKLIISSEWDYSPFVYRAMVDLPGFVLIGLPAPESANPLLIPLAGHELGHSVWAAENLFSSLKNRVEDLVLNEIKETQWEHYKKIFNHEKTLITHDNLLVRSTWLPAFDWALRQAEEIFCDFFGLQLFAESFVHAFAYILSPGTPGQRSVLYPNIKRRVSYLMKAAKAMEVHVHSEFDSDFMPAPEPKEPSTSLWVSVADSVSASLVPELIKRAQEIAASRGVPLRNTKKVVDICSEFHKIVPIQESHSLTDILNAGWSCYLNPDLWSNFSQIKMEDKDRLFKDLILKSLDVSEVYEKLYESP